MGTKTPKNVPGVFELDRHHYFRKNSSAARGLRSFTQTVLVFFCSGGDRGSCVFVLVNLSMIVVLVWCDAICVAPCPEHHQV